MKQNHDLLMSSLGRFYGAEENIKTVVDIAEGRADISLRVIDWFVTNYAKKKNIIHKRVVSTSRAAPSPPPSSQGRGEGLPGPESVAFFSVYLSYRNELQTYSKQQFDPFRRNEHIVFRYGDGGELETTVGQLNFFRWAIENGILDYIRAHKKDIEESMSGKRDAEPGFSACAACGSKTGPVPAEAVKGSGTHGRKKHRRPPVVIPMRSVISFD